MEDNIKNLKVEYLINHWSDPTKIFSLRVVFQAEIYRGLEDNLKI